MSMQRRDEQLDEAEDEAEDWEEAVKMLQAWGDAAFNLGDEELAEGCHRLANWLLAANRR